MEPNRFRESSVFCWPFGFVALFGILLSTRVTTSIQILPPDLASQIAAGEVVERPSSVIKELVENSLDAGSTRVDVAIEGGGITSISISDDGHGMNEESAVLALERHATSKLRAMEDLETLLSFGFRGEALPSIASVSRMTITTRSRDEDAGSQVLAEGTTSPTTKPTGAPVGTTIEVRDLFFNVPARRKFLRSSNTESGHVAEMLTQLALGRPDVTFTLKRDGRSARNYPRVATRAERVAQVLDGEELIPTSGQRGPLNVEAYLSRPERARQGAAGLRLVVCGRSVRDRALAATIAHAYGSVLERGRYPRGVVYLDLAGSLVDVNVHPQKTEVRFADPRAVSDALYGIVSRGLARALSEAPGAVPGRRGWAGDRGAGDRGAGDQRGAPAPGASATAAGDFDPGAPRPAPRSVIESGRPPASDEAAANAFPSPWSSTTPQPPRVGGMGGTDSGAPLLLRDHAPPPSGQRYELPPPTEGGERPISAPAVEGESQATGWKNLRFLSQVRNTFLICEGDDGLYVLDQHAAAERVIFSKLQAAYEARDVSAQRLLFPTVVPVSAREAELIEERQGDIRRLGLDVRARGEDSASIHAVPRLLQKASPERLLRDLLRELPRSGERSFSDAIDKVLATMACHAAVRAGDALSATEAQALLTSLDTIDFAGYCPHGRPIVTFSSWLELERKVGRR